jgi:hypothetical protein
MQTHGEKENIGKKKNECDFAIVGLFVLHYLHRVDDNNVWIKYSNQSVLTSAYLFFFPLYRWLFSNHSSFSALHHYGVVVSILLIRYEF